VQILVSIELDITAAMIMIALESLKMMHNAKKYMTAVMVQLAVYLLLVVLVNK
jgi:hypothetical protein